jgi:hypothetical protein
MPVASCAWLDGLATRLRIGKAIVAPPLPDRNPKKRPWGIPASPAGGYASPAAMVAAPARRDCLPQRLTAGRSTAIHSLDMPRRMA